MKVFISWSGDRSKQLAEVIHWWLPNVLQFVKPYFTPADMEKGTRWDNEISKELGQSQIGIIASSLPIPLFMQGYELPSMDWMKASSLKATNLIARCASVPTLGQVDDLISVDTEDHLLLTRQLDDEFQLLAGRMH